MENEFKMTDSEKQALESKRAESKELTIKCEDGVLLPSTSTELYRVAQVYCKSGMLPKGFDTPEKVIVGLQFTKELGMKPGLLALRNVYIVNGTPSIFGELPLALVRASGQLQEIDEYCLDDKGNRISVENKNLTAKISASVCTVTRRGFATITRTFLSNEAPTNAIWTKYFEIMMKRRVRSIALKDCFGDILMGIPIMEYDHDALMVNGKCEGVPEQASVNDLNEKFRSK